MNKFNSPSSNNSGTSSETSETQSVEDINAGVASSTGLTNTRIPQSWKRIKDANSDKDAEVKRPPWRSVSVSTLPKPDKSALLKAKLLDASRRLRAGKSSVALQVNLEPTKILKEVNLGIQTDLILRREAGVITDGSYKKRKEGTEEFILTYAVSQMTDKIQMSDIGTQTFLPKLVNDEFMDTYVLQTLTTSCFPSKSDNSEIMARNVDSINSSTSENAISDTDTDTNTFPTVKSFKTSDPSNSFGSKQIKPTLASWHFDLNMDGSNDYSTFQPYIITPQTNWRNFIPLPTQMQRNNNVDWSLFLLAIDDLIEESNRLVDLIKDAAVSSAVEQQTAMEIQQTGLSFQPHKLYQPSEYWLPIIEQQEKELKNLMTQNKPKSPKASIKDNSN